MALYYPAFWISFSIFQAAPALVRVAARGDQLVSFEISPLGLVASSLPTNPARQTHESPLHPDLFSLVLYAGLLFAVVAVLAVVGRACRTLSGFLVAILADVLLLPWLAGLLFAKAFSARIVFEAAPFFVVLCVGLRWMLVGWVRAGYWGRVTSLFAGFVLLPLPLWTAIRLSTHVPFWPVLLAMGPSGIAALVVSIRPVSGQPERWRWTLVAVGAAVTILLAAAVAPARRAANRAFARARAAKAQAEMAAIPEVPANAPYPKVFFQRGVNFTAEWPARYDSEAARQMLRRLPAYGVNAIALVPYGWSSAKPPRVHIGGGPDTWESDEGVEILARLAHSLGMKVMLKPAIWDSYKLEIDSAQDRARWFDQYGLFLDHYARLATRIHADLFFVGGEFDHLSEYDSDWRKLIARVRPLYPGPLIYGANFGKEFATLTFWDALDCIGLQEYYPLPDDLSTDSLVQKVEAVQRKYGKPVIFTEAGFPAYQSANRQPWEDTKGGKIDVAEQARCYDAILRAFYKQPWFEGVYWWKVGTDDEGDPEDGSLTPWGKPAMDVVKRWYLEGGR